MKRHTLLAALALPLFALGCGSFDSDPPPANPTGPDGGPDPVGGKAADESLIIDPITTRTFVVQDGAATKIPVKVRRGPQQTKAIEVKLNGLPAGVIVDPLTIPIGASSGELVVKATGAASQGPIEAKLEATAGSTKAGIDVPLFVRGAPGTLDRTFGEGGRLRDVVAASGSTFPRELIVDDADNVYVVAECAVGADYGACVAKLSPEGKLDAGYGDKGIGFSSAVNAIGGAAIQADGKIILGHYGTANTTIVRLDDKGKPDATFGDAVVGPGSYMLADPYGIADGTRAIAVRPDKAIIVAYDQRNGPNYSIGFAKLGTNGKIDTSFGAQGYAASGWGATVNISWGMGIRADNRIWCVGAFESGATPSQKGVGIVQLLPTGLPDQAFGTTGVKAYPNVTSGNTPKQGIATELADGRIVAGHESGLFAHAKDGKALDTVYGGGDGVASLPVGYVLSGIARQTDGKVVGIGATGAGPTGPKTILYRADANGGADATFGTAGQSERDEGFPVRVGLQKKTERAIVLFEAEEVPGSNRLIAVVARFWL